MALLVYALAVAAPGFFRLGRLHLPVYGVFAAVGLLAALWLSQRTALRVGLSADRVWDAGVFAVIAAFVASRALLVVFNLRAFLTYPVLVLSLPSLTYAGMVLTGFAVWWYLRWKGLPWRDVTDAWAPCGALLAAVLSVGHFVEGTDAGMPTEMPWGVVTAGDTVLGRVHPVQLYEAALALVFCIWWFRRLGGRRYAGQIASQALILGGLAAFLLDFLRQPLEGQGSAWLDPGQYIALACVTAGVVMRMVFCVPHGPITRLEAAVILENFVLGGNRYEHELIEDGKFSDPLLLLEVQQQVFFGAMTEEQQGAALEYARRLRVEPPPPSLPLDREKTITREQAADILEHIVSGGPKSLLHEQIYYGRFKDPLLKELHDRFPNIYEAPYWGDMSEEEGKRLMLEYALRLRTEPAPKEGTS